MASLYRPTVIRYLDSQGRQVRKGTPGARRVREKSKTIWGRYTVNGEIKRVSLSDDREAAETKLNEIVKRARREEAGDIDPFQDHRQRPTAEHLAGFRESLESKDNTASHVTLTVNRVTAAFDGCGFKRLADLNAGRVAGWLADRRKPKTDKEGNVIAGLSVASSNHHLVAVKSFGNWLVKNRRWPENPFAHLSRLNAQADVRHERRASSLLDLGLLVSAAETSQKKFRGLDGSTRAMLYRLAAMTGLRAKELASLTAASFDLTADVPTVTVEAGYSKRRRRDVLPLHQDLAARLRQWLSERKRQQDDQRVILTFNRAADAKPEPLFPGTWPKKAAKMLRADLDAAEIAYVTDEGFADFHSLRHTFVSNLAAGGVHPKLAQQLARHSTIALTLDRYTHVGLLDMNTALESLPNIIAPESQTMRATGTTDQAASDFSCTKSCTHPPDLTGHNRSQPFATVADGSEAQTTPSTTKPRFPAENEAFCDDSAASESVKVPRLERGTYGLKVRCSTN